VAAPSSWPDGETGTADALAGRLQPAFEQRERQRCRDKALLGAVMQVALDPPARLVGGRDQPRAGGRELLAVLGVLDRE
jgi:hypothetical protein